MALRDVGNQFVEIFRKLTTLQKVSMVAATVAVLVTVVVLVLWANKPPYKTLYADMPEADVKELSEALDNKKISYKVINGNSIEVPEQDVYAARLMLAQEGLPRDTGVGLELFDKTTLGMTEFQQKVYYQRAIQGELSRSITAINEVVEAKVHITFPNDRLFVTEEDEAKASVVVRLLQGKSLSPEQVDAISHLIASSVRGLKPELVQVVDTNGKLLSRLLSEEQNQVQLSNTQLEQQRQVEKELESKLNGMLATTLGNDKFVARVSVEMDYSKRSVERVDYGDTPVLRHQETIEISESGKRSNVAGVPGVESNLAEPNVLVDDIISQYSATSEKQDFEIATTITREEKNSSDIKRITVAVVVDDRPELQEENGVKTTIKKPRTDDEITKIRTVVASAIGFNSGRGDIVEVTNISFDTSGEWFAVADAQKDKTMEWIGMAIKYASAVLILLLFYLLLIRPILKRLDNARELDEELLGESAIDAQLASLDITVGGESGFPKSLEDLEREIESELDGSVPVNVEAVKSKVMLKKIEEASQDDPEMVANLVKALIKGG